MGLEKRSFEGESSQVSIFDAHLRSITLNDSPTMSEDFGLGS